jgi:hypothetical protein
VKVTAFAGKGCRAPKLAACAINGSVVAVRCNEPRWRDIAAVANALGAIGICLEQLLEQLPYTRLELLRLRLAEYARKIRGWWPEDAPTDAEFRERQAAHNADDAAEVQAMSRSAFELEDGSGIFAFRCSFDAERMAGALNDVFPCWCRVRVFGDDDEGHFGFISWIVGSAAPFEVLTTAPVADGDGDVSEEHSFCPVDGKAATYWRDGVEYPGAGIAGIWQGRGFSVRWSPDDRNGNQPPVAIKKIEISRI